MATNTTIDAGGKSSLITGGLLYIADNFSLLEVNDILVTITTFLGMIFVIYKIIGQMTENKIKKKKLKEINEIEKANRPNS